MRLSELLQQVSVRRRLGPTDADVSGLRYDSRRVQPGDVFFAWRGQAQDGHRFLADAAARGAAALVVEELPERDFGPAIVQVDNSRQAMAAMAQAFYGDPTRDMAVVGVTGTNGKTTTTYLLEAVLAEAGMAPAVVGTVSYRFGQSVHNAPHTTPEAVELLEQVAAFRAEGARSLVMEVSSHALDQYRADGIRFRVGIFTNLTPEHLDYHGDMDRYFASKLRLFRELLPAGGGRAVVNIDDAYGARLAGLLPGALTCGHAAQAQVRPERLAVTLDGIHGSVVTPSGTIRLDSPLLGDYNVENLLGAIGGAVALGLPPAVIERGLARAAAVPGRLERVDNRRGAVALVDYAHTGDALDRVLQALQALKPARIITVFGCGGDRDPRKRPVMGEVTARRSDIAIVTSDNPRTEDPLQIIEQIRKGVATIHPREWSCEEAVAGGGRGYVVIPDRRAAIRFAVSLLQPNDVLLVAGKGHEDYQILGTTRIHFDDREELRNAFAEGAGA
ncbi:MAG: UDP-N-acetylmuramoyl-L-alanyl-D-glutamate--2,6-diaminopimelate ligase [Deltaproteobacteria bacterium]|nr:MAG: UDP-N-acetylmuramoyl-L-alanyl-D-glutamate--2,6-diaminopimelate ligase [Deltaproteobacteria bacterium]